jgi:DNA-binding IclR family transcriptional regulator
VLSIEIGARRPLGVGVSGLVLLAALPPDEAAELVRRSTRRLRALHVEPAELLERLQQTRAQGYAYAARGVVQGSARPGRAGARAQGRTLAGLAIATITERLPEARIATVVAQMQERAALIAAQAAELAHRRAGAPGRPG